MRPRNAGHDQEVEQLERAIEESRRDYYVTTGGDSRTPPRPLSESYQRNEPKEQRKGRDTQNDLVILRLGVEVDHMRFPDADTMVLIDPPPRLKDQSSSSYAEIVEHYSKYHFVHSQKLFDIGSTKFEKLLSVDKQTRQQRTLRKVLPYGKPVGIKYILDLRPPNEDEEAILFVTELSCTSGILKWHKAGHCFGVSPLLINGQDDIEYVGYVEDTSSKLQDPFQGGTAQALNSPVIVDGTKETQEPTKPAKSKKPPPALPRILNWDGNLPKPPPIQVNEDQEDTGAIQPTSPKKSPVDGPSTISERDQRPPPPHEHEYSPLRHRSAIERLLSAIEHEDPRLDSAPKVWNYFAVAKHFECATHERINGWITKWLYAYPNSNFIQCNPEVCYRIGLGINSYDLTKDAFSILVGEQALMRVRNHGRATSSTSVHGRKRENLDDDEQNRVTHAADQLVARIQATFQDLLAVRPHFFAANDQYDELLKFTPDNEHEELVKHHLMQNLRGYVRMRILAVLYRASLHYVPYDTVLSSHLESKTEAYERYISGCSSFKETYFNLAGEERIFTRTFWMMLNAEFFTEDLAPDFAGEVANRCWSLLSTFSQGLEPLPMVSKSDLEESVNSYNRMLIEINTRTSDAFSRESSREFTRENEDNVQAMQNLSVSSPKRPHFNIPETAASSDISKRRKLAPEPEGQLYATNPDFQPEVEQTTSSSPRIKGEKTLRRTDFDSMKGTALPVRTRATRDVPGGSEHFNAEDRRVPEEEENNDDADIWYPFPDRPSSPSSTRANINVPASAAIGEASDQTNDNPFLTAYSPVITKPHISPSSFGAFSRPTSTFHTRPEWTPAFRLYDFLQGVSTVISNITVLITNPPHLWHLSDRLPTQLIDTLMCLDEEEWKYLPLWAGGNDDGTGGVFDETNVPNLEAGGFSAPGPSIHTGQTPATSMVDGSDGVSITSEDFSDIGSEARSTVGKASAKATEGTVTDTSVRSINSTVSEVGAENMDPLWEMVRGKQAGISDLESTIDGEEDSDSVVPLDKGKARADNKTFLPNDLNPHLDINDDDDRDMYADDNDDDDGTERLSNPGSDVVDDNDDEDFFGDDDWKEKVVASRDGNDDDDDDDGFEHV